MIDVKALMPFIIPYAPTCPDIVAAPLAVATIADFCEQTGCLRTTCEVDVSAGTPEFDIPQTDDIEPENVLHMYIGDRELRPTLVDLVSRATYGDWTVKQGGPVAYTMVNRHKVHLVPAPDEDVTVKVIFLGSVPRTSTTVPDEFLDHFRDAVVDGTLARIFRIAGQPFSNARLADMYEMRYERAVQAVKGEAMQDFMRIGGTVLPNRII